MTPVSRIASAIVALCTGMATSVVPAQEAAQDSAFYGLLRQRDLSPFGLLRLDMRPAHAIAIEPGTWAIELELGYQNTWALSPEVEEYLIGLEPTGRRDLGEAEVQAIRDLPGENYLIDFESAALDLTFHYKISTNWTAYLIASAVSYQGGFLDSSIESFHDAFGFSTFGRPAVTRDDVNVIFDLKSSQVASFGSPTDGGITDPTIGVRYVGLPLPNPWRMTLEAAVKIPIDGKRLLLSTGKADYGLQASFQRFGAHHAWYFNLAGVYYAGSSELVPQDSKVIPTLLIGYERILTPRTNLILQGYISDSVYSHEQTDLDVLLERKYQLSLGLRHRTDNFLFTFGFTENLQNINNTPDIGFQLGVAYIPRQVSNRP